MCTYTVRTLILNVGANISAVKTVQYFKLKCSSFAESILDARKPVFGVCEQQRCRPACASIAVCSAHFAYWKVSYPQWNIQFGDEDVFCKFWFGRRLRHVFKTFISKTDVCRTSQKRFENSMQTCLTSSICNHFGVTHTSCVKNVSVTLRNH